MNTFGLVSFIVIIFFLCFHHNQIEGKTIPIEKTADLNIHQMPVIQKRQESDEDDHQAEEDDPTFWEAAQNYGRNRWENMRSGFTELLDVFRAGGRDIRNLFTNDE